MVEGWRRSAAIVFAASLVLVSAAGVPAQAADTGEDGAQNAADAKPAATEEDEGPNKGRISLLIQNDFTNAYIFRGIMQERDGFIWQPWAEVSLSLFEAEEGAIRGVSLGMGVWNSFQTEKTLATHSPTNLYETDWYPMLNIDFAHGFSLLTTYYIYTSPNGGFDTVQEVAMKGSWDDSEALGRAALNPSATLVAETDRTSFGDKRGTAAILAIAPTLYDGGEDVPLSLSVPIETGLSLDNYYEEPGRSNKHFGYLSWGLVATVPLGFVPDDYGSWSASVGGRGYYFSNALTRVNSGDRLYPQVVGSLTVEY
jgi:hypothetical protein